MVNLLPKALIIEMLYLGQMTAWVMPPGEVGAFGTVALLLCFLPYVIRYRLAFGYQGEDKSEWDPWRP